MKSEQCGFSLSSPVPFRTWSSQNAHPTLGFDAFGCFQNFEMCQKDLCDCLLWSVTIFQRRIDNILRGNLDSNIYARILYAWLPSTCNTLFRIWRQKWRKKTFFEHLAALLHFVHVDFGANDDSAKIMKWFRLLSLSVEFQFEINFLTSWWWCHCSRQSTHHELGSCCHSVLE